MKKHFLRTLVVMLMACLGVGVLAACGEDPAPTPTTDPIEGVWSVTQGSTKTLVTVDLVENQSYAGWAVFDSASGSDRFIYRAKLTKSEDTYTGSIDMDGMEESLSLKLTAEEKLEVTVAVDDDSQVITLPTKATLPTAPTLSGKYYVARYAEIDFTAKTLTITDGEPVSFTTEAVGGYLFVSGTMDGHAFDFPAFAENGKTYMWAGETAELTTTKPEPAATYTIVYQTVGVTAPVDSREYKVGDEVILPSVSRPQYEFDGWELFGSDDEELYQAGSTYIVAAGDADQNNEITFMAKFSFVGGDVTEKYTVTYMDVEYNGQPLPNDTNEYDVGDTIQIPDTEPQATGHTFMGWSLNGATTPLYKYGTDHASYTITGDEEMKDLTFIAVWDSPDVPEPDDISGVWTYEETTITIKLEADGESGHMIMAMSDTYTYYALTKTQGWFGFSDDYGDVSGTITVSNDSITVTISSNPITLTEKTALDPEITITGKYTFNAGAMGGSGNGTIDFDTNKANFTGEEGTFTSIKVGKYIVVSLMGQNIVFYEKGGTYYFSMGSEIELTKDSGTTTHEYTVKFFAEKDSYEEEPFKTITVTEGTKITEDDEYESVGTPTKDNYTFAAWKTKHSDFDLDTMEASATLAEEGGDHIIIVYATWTLKETEIGNDVYTNSGQWTAYNGNAHTPGWHDVLHKGETVTVTGTLKYEFLATDPWRGVVAHLYNGEQTNGGNPGVCINHRNDGSAADGLWAAPTNTDSIHNVMVNGARNPEGDPYPNAETQEQVGETKITMYLKALQLMGTNAGAKFTVKFSWVFNSEIYVTIIYESNDAQTYVSKSYIYKEASSGSLIANESYNIGLDVDNGYIKVTGLEREEGTIGAKPADTYGIPSADGGYVPNAATVGTIKQGSKFTVTGTQKSYSGTAWQGFALNFDGKTFRPDNWINDIDNGTLTNGTRWVATKTPTVTPSTTDWFGDMRVIVRDCTFTLTVDWKSAEDVITITYAYVAAATNTAVAGKTFTQTYTIKAVDASALDTENGYAVILTFEGAYGTGVTINANAN